MNYCTLEDAWKNSDYISDQFKLYQNPYEKNNIIENFDYNVTSTNTTESNFNSLSNNLNINKSIKNQSQPVICSFTCDDFLDHLNSCAICRKKMRERFSSKVIERIQNLILDNKDSILLILIAFFILIFFNLLLSIFKK